MDVYTFVIIFSLAAGCSCANIFCIYPTPSYSTQQPMLAISHELARRGHNLTVITPNPSKVPLHNHRDIDVNFLYERWREEESIGLQSKLYPTDTVLNFYVDFVKFVTNDLLEAPQVKDLIREINGTKFDLILYDTIGYSSLLGFSDLIGNPPIIGVMPMSGFEPADVTMGNPVTPSYIPSLMSNVGSRMTFFERVQNAWVNLLMFYVIASLESFHEDLSRKHFGNIRHTPYELEYNKSLQIIISDLSTSFPRPVQPNTIVIGSTHVRPAERLPKDLQKWMDGAEDGVIYFSLGSNMKGTSMDEKRRQIFIKTFAQFPKMRILWKWESDEKLPGLTDNVLQQKWFPQPSVLAHPKLKFFISQIGLQSFQEAVYYGVPILAIPLFTDQSLNSKKLVSSGAGLSQDYDEITYEEFYSKVKEMLTNNSYKENMLRLRTISKDKPMSSIDTAIWWIEYVLRHHGAPHLRPTSLDLSWYQYFMLDIMFSIIAVISIFIYVIYYILIKVIGSKTKKINKVKKN